MSKNLNREKQTLVLRQAQEQRKQQKKQIVLQAIQEILKSGEPLNFPIIAKMAGCSVSYLYKWPEITAYIHDLQNQKNQKLHLTEPKQPGVYSLKTLHEVSKQRIRELEAENQELKRQNDLLRSHVAEIFELRSESERLRVQIIKLMNGRDEFKVVPLQTKSNTNRSNFIDEIPQEIIESIKGMGIKLGVRLQREILAHEQSMVKLAIEAFRQYRSQNTITNPGACLLLMIREEAKPKADPIINNP